MDTMKRRLFCLFPFLAPATPLIAECAIAERRDKSEDIEQLRVQLAGCGVAALGWANGPNACKKGEWGWSASFQDVVELRLKYEEAKADYHRACETIAKMHAAAVGEVTGPRRGVVEDIEDMRLWAEGCLKVNQLLGDTLAQVCAQHGVPV